MNKTENFNALVIGAGGFGKHYARILSQLESSDLTSSIDSIIITRTSLDSALAQAEDIQKNSQRNIIGAKISNLDELKDVLDKYKPAFTAVAAKDRKIGDDIHPLYVAHSIRYGIVLCEKPFANARGDGKSLDFFDFTKLNKFGLELPFFVIYNSIEQNIELYQRLLNAKSIRFAWFTKGVGDDVIDNLILHPWSLIPSEFILTEARVEDEGSKAKLDIDYYYKGRKINIEIFLIYGSNFTGFEIDGCTMGIKREGAINTIIDTGLPLEKTAELGNEGLKGKELLAVKNPLKQHIIAALNGNPIVGLKKAYDSQLFLEIIHRYLNE